MSVPLSPMRLCICFHDQCFDGACSAALFTRVYQARLNAAAEFHYRGLVHRAGQLFDESMFDGDENAIVDFKYSSSERLNWWFDHHQSAFLTAADAEHFRRDTTGRKFYNPDFRSCTKFIAHIAAEKWGFHARDLDDMVKWADIIDGAQYPDTRTAVELRDPATQLTLVIEGVRTPGFVASIIPELTRKSLAEIVALPRIRQAFDELYARHLQWMKLIGERGELADRVLFFDVADQEFEGFNKFIPYHLFPEAVYSVAVSASPGRTKIAVGSNPWNPARKAVNLASICERYNGGGHAKVAAISLPPGQLDHARAVARDIVAELRQSVRDSGQ
ncbi:MAG TPA: DHH family phosphoesterase [Terriglobia bacterium]|nr:DHH family phosphoesterase [Terriglobia bacterium]